MRRRAWTAWLAWLVLVGAWAPLLVIQAEAGGCDRIVGGPERCVHHERTIAYRLMGARIDDVVHVQGEVRDDERWSMRWLDLHGPATLAIRIGSALLLAGAATLPVASGLAHRRPDRWARTARVAWCAMAAGATTFLLAALVHATRNDAARGWPGWGLALVALALVSGLSLKPLREARAAGGPLPALPSFG